MASTGFAIGNNGARGGLTKHDHPVPGRVSPTGRVVNRRDGAKGRTSDGVSTTAPNVGLVDSQVRLVVMRTGYGPYFCSRGFPRRRPPSVL